MILLTVKDVSKAFVMKQVLENVNLVIQQGQRMGLVGFPEPFTPTRPMRWPCWV